MNRLHDRGVYGSVNAELRSDAYDVSVDEVGVGNAPALSSYLDQGGTTPLLRAYAIDCPRCSC